MRKIGLFFVLINIVCLCFYACDSVCSDVDLPVTESTFEDGVDSEKVLANSCLEAAKLAKYIKYEDEKLFIDLTKKKAAVLGVSDAVYDKCVAMIEERNEQVQEILSAGGTYTFLINYQNIRIFL